MGEVSEWVVRSFATVVVVIVGFTPITRERKGQGSSRSSRSKKSREGGKREDENRRGAQKEVVVGIRKKKKKKRGNEKQSLVGRQRSVETKPQPKVAIDPSNRTKENQMARLFSLPLDTGTERGLTLDRASGQLL